MALDLLSTSGINSLISQYTISEMNKKILPLQERMSRYESLSSSYGTLSSSLGSLKSLLESFQETGTSSIFSSKTASSSNTSFVNASVSSSVVASMYAIRVNQLAKSDVLLTSDFTSAGTNSLTGVHNFLIKTGDGEGGSYASNVEVTFDGSETNETALEKIRNAINADKADVLSASHAATDTFTGSGSFVINVNGTETTVDYDYDNMTYDEVMDDLVTKITDDVGGISAEKVVNGSNVELKLTVSNSSDYITIDQSQDSGGLLGAGILNIDVKNEKGASGSVSASLFSPETLTSQLSLTAKETGLSNRIMEISDSSGGLALSTFGLNLGTSRPDFDQTPNPDTAGFFVYSDINSATTALNSSFEFNGLTIRRDSNVISDLVDGMTLSLLAVMDAEDTTVSVAVNNDTESIKAKIEEFISQFNEVYTYLKSNSSSSSGIRGVFMGDSNASSLMSTFRTMGYASIDGIVDGNLNKLSDIGISFDPNAGLSLSNSTLLEQKLTGEVDQVEAIFNSVNGLANTLYDSVDPFLGIDGYLATTQSRFDTNAKYYEDKITATTNRIDSSAEIMRGRYEELQMQLASFLSVQSYFGNLGGGF